MNFSNLIGSSPAAAILPAVGCHRRAPLRIGDAPVPEPTRKRFRELRAADGSLGKARGLGACGPSFAPFRQASHALPAARDVRAARKARDRRSSCKTLHDSCHRPWQKPARATRWCNAAGGVPVSAVVRAKLCLATSCYILFTALGEWLTFAIGGIEPLRTLPFVAWLDRFCRFVGKWLHMPAPAA